MTDAYSREEQNSHLLTSLQQKSQALKHITLNIYDQARDQTVLDNTNEAFSNMGQGMRGSMTRLGRMARQGDGIAIGKVVGILVGSVLFLWIVGGWIWRLVFGS